MLTDLYPSLEAQHENFPLYRRDLHLQDSTSDKVYIVTIETPSDESFCLVSAHYGRRGSTLQTTTKGQTKTLAQAEHKVKILIDQKIKKGYKDLGSWEADHIKGHLNPEVLELYQSRYLHKEVISPKGVKAHVLHINVNGVFELQPIGSDIIHYISMDKIKYFKIVGEESETNSIR